MKGNRALITTVVVIAVLILGWWLFRRGGGSGTIDLMAQFDSADKRPPTAVFKVEDVTLNGETKKAIAIEPAMSTRVIFKVKVPDYGWFRVNVGLKPEAWTKPGDGVLFMMLVSDGRASDQLFTQHVNPFANASDRKWTPVMVDLSAYAGEQVEIIMNTYASLPDKVVGDQQNDYSLWGAPEIVVR